LEEEYLPFTLHIIRVKLGKVEQVEADSIIMNISSPGLSYARDADKVI
jgi:hypothetical protein